MRSFFVRALPCFVVLLASAACGGPTGSDADSQEGALGEVLTELDVPIEGLQPGHSIRVTVKTGAAFEARVSQSDTADADRVLAALSIRADDGSTRNVEPSQEPVLLIDARADRKTAAYTIEVLNKDDTRPLSGKLHVGAPPGGSARVDVQGYIVGAFASSRDDATKSWNEACDAWKARLAKIAGADHIESSSCGTAVNLSSFGTQLESEPKATVVAQVGAGAEIHSIEATTVAGSFTSARADSIASWDAACSAAIDAQKQLYGDRLVAASCAKPTNLSSSGFRYQGLVVANVAAGKSVASQGFLAGAFTSDSTDALADWQRRCQDLAMSSMKLFGQDRIAAFQCGEPKNVSASGFRYSSTPTLAVTTLVDGDPATADPVTIEGEFATDMSDAATSFSDKCSAAITKAHADFGARLLTGLCGVPQNESGSGFRYKGSVSLQLDPIR